MSGTAIESAAISCYAISGTDVGCSALAHGVRRLSLRSAPPSARGQGPAAEAEGHGIHSAGMLLRGCYAMSGAESACGTTRETPSSCNNCSEYALPSAYALAMRCPVLTCAYDPTRTGRSRLSCVRARAGCACPQSEVSSYGSAMKCPVLTYGVRTTRRDPPRREWAADGDGREERGGGGGGGG
eukprot:444079-Rhodomonas_salina.2